MSNYYDRDRVEIDPENRYHVSGMTRVESQASRMLDLFPRYQMERTRDLFQFTGDGSDDPVIVVTPDSFEIRLPQIEWPHPNIPALSSRLWKRLDWEDLDDKTLVRLVEEARQIRLAQYRECRFCGSRALPEHLTEGACDDCAVGHLGIIH